MIASMTGFGKGETESNGNSVTVEVRTVNGRYGDVSIHQPRALSELEPRIKDVVLESISRGRVDINITVRGESSGQGVPTLNEETIAAYREGLSALKTALGIEGDLELATVASLPGVFTFEAPPVDVEETWAALEPACRRAVEECTRMRRVEGAKLAADFEARIGTLAEAIAKVEALAPNRVAASQQKLEEKLKALLGPEQVDETRLLMEIAIIADRGDITEECVRFKSHIGQFHEAIISDEAVGRRLNFLLQEMLREVNTIGSKAADADIAHVVVSMKEEIEKLKEQVLNVE